MFIDYNVDKKAMYIQTIGDKNSQNPRNVLFNTKSVIFTDIKYCKTFQQIKKRAASVEPKGNGND